MMFGKATLLPVALAALAAVDVTGATHVSNADLIRKGLPINQPATFEKRIVNGQTRTLPGTRVRTAKRAQTSAVPPSFVGHLIYRNPSPNQETKYYMTPNDGGAFGGLSLHATDSSNEIKLKWYDTGLVSPLTQLKYYQVKNEAGDSLCGAHNGAVGSDAAATLPHNGDGNSFLTFCTPQSPPGTVAACYSVSDSAGHNCYMDWTFTIDPATKRVGFEWYNPDKTTVTGPWMRADNGYSYFSRNAASTQATFDSFFGLESDN